LPAQLKTGDSTECMDAIIKNKQHYQDCQEYVWALVKFFGPLNKGGPAKNFHTKSERLINNAAIEKDKP